MKQYTKIVLLAIFVLLLTLTACQRSVSTAPVASPTPSGEAPFPFETTDPFATIRTQTAVALNPPAGQPTATPAVEVATATLPPEGVAPPPSSTPTPAPGAVTIPEVVRPATYALQKGEWPICIARRYNVDLSTLLSMNGLNMNSKPAVGFVLSIPSSGTWNSAHGPIAWHSHPTTHSVVSGETVYTIACFYGNVAPEQILAANSLSSPSDVQPGMQLKIP